MTEQTSQNDKENAYLQKTQMIYFLNYGLRFQIKAYIFKAIIKRQNGFRVIRGELIANGSEIKSIL